MHRVWAFVAEYSVLLRLGAISALIRANIDARSHHAFVEFPLSSMHGSAICTPTQPTMSAAR
jgi:hypothetical protein